ncbi:Signal transduction histidine kinase [Anaerocolumna jejuensis DSM 15929]|uniref:histidine kinase n=1 Tax=Anaerocolumna jejuensis DSM 15929 TaxID=1121322 RepID=A0A1M6VN88_9FIRM|nr:HAMP domain-containing sensor histidine kinase [Anaerocolumna jejuensis]SHK82972.1 Signal transduction histidine kinase [Anaerocolumna jejuensis DSM 15929]
MMIPILSILLCLVTILFCYLYLNKVLGRISTIIDMFISKRTVEDTDVSDTRESKLISQLKRLLLIAKHDMNSSKEEKEMVTRLISDLSHQLKTPLANITMYVEILKTESLSEEEREEFIQRTGEQAAKMEWLLKSLFKTSRLETGIIEFNEAPSFIKETIADSISAVFSQAEKKQIRIVLEECEDRKLFHNRKWTVEALSNILENAVKYSPESSEIKISLVPMELYTKIQIEDQGIGIPSEEFNLIFRRFYRSEQVEQKEGTGLGLYLSQLILSKQGGYVTVDSKVGKGSKFSVFLKNDLITP